ncbi:MAG: PilZ domain-containing protein [Thermodesulfobacteriota bacterium]
MMRSGGSQPTERRASTRIDARVPIKMNPPNASPVISGKTQDISLVGMRVRTEITPPFQIRDEVMFLVSEPYFKFQGQGEILWTSSPKGKTVGIKFTQVDEEARRSLDEFLSLFVNVPTGNH